MLNASKSLEWAENIVWSIHIPMARHQNLKQATVSLVKLSHFHVQVQQSPPKRSSH